MCSGLFAVCYEDFPCGQPEGRFADLFHNGI